MMPPFYRRRRRLINLGVLGVLIGASLLLSFLLRFEFAIPPEEFVTLQRALWLALAVKLPVLWLFGRERPSWRHLSVFDLSALVSAQATASLVFTIAALWRIGPSFPRSIYLLDFLLLLLMETSLRVAIRAFWEPRLRASRKGDCKGVLIYGAGLAGATLLREIRANSCLRYRVAGFLDDEPGTRGQSVMGVTVLASGREAAVTVDRLRKRGTPVDEIILAMPSATPEMMREALANCRAADVLVRKIPGVGELLASGGLTNQIHSVSVEDLLGREPIRLDESTIRSSIRGRTVMVTGGAGSIGSELCRQILRYGPGKLVVFERAESDLFRIDLELRQAQNNVGIEAVVGDIRDRKRVSEVISAFEVQSIFHAAAYKHVPLMEAHPLEAVSNNVLGTWTLVESACEAGIDNFLMISTDKAVNATSIMGLTKRVAELIVASGPTASAGRTRFVSVRFGNVLGSNGSVVPLFEKQIAAGGPITVTHPEMRRYFMTIPEAAQLVLQASTMGKGGEIFVLDMGQPMRIIDLARNMIRLSGKVPDVDIEIRYTGLRPGEKLYEELNLSDEKHMPTYHDKVHIFQGEPRDPQEIRMWVNCIQAAMEARDEATAVSLMSDLVREYTPTGRWKRVVEERAMAFHP